VVTKGARADLMLVRGDPLRDLTTLSTPLGVMADGRWYPQQDLDARMEEVRVTYAAAAASERANSEGASAR
jgi:hypothetical protein